mmetsp:Transcript_10650/g.20209  ORF Transcript_10650/g.20209 Transcript_10650/m.20209 type:complete len:498 (-) Transcript_10650:328-1821(-)|eukprot:CAMPEP_0175129750 /NCGR_PEP_ID=MMETSP0087-20121206/5639_1 /TAXON_ID=136419 /ORGANISM="Unknown Unknown, Strain D1" /LENGTH=497 /DNA_ID=CAMNT_0016411921 /DNA_START=138 /DNA_END=1631 /DNA_ORIENTATION=+
MRQTRNTSRAREPSEIEYKDIEFGRQIGEGEYGRIFKGQLWDQTVALKVLKECKLKDQEAVDDFFQEMSTMQQLQHPNIVQYMGFCKQKPKLTIITEYLPNGCLEKYLNKKGIRTCVPLDMAIEMALDIARGLNWMHHRGFIHRDLKPANVLVDKNHTIKIADFGLASSFENRNSDPTITEDYFGQAGTMFYMSPEVLMNEKYGVKADIYSFAVVFCELLNSACFRNYGSEPRSEKREDAFARQIWNGLRPSLPKNVPSVLSQLISQCWAHKAEDRPNLSNVVSVLTQVLKDVKAGGDGNVTMPAAMKHLLTGKRLRTRKGRQREHKSDKSDDDQETDNGDSSDSGTDSEFESQAAKKDTADEKKLKKLQDVLDTTKSQLAKEKETKQEMQRKLEGALLQTQALKDDIQMEALRHDAEIRALRKQLANALAKSSPPDKENVPVKTSTKNTDTSKTAKRATKKRGVLDSLNVNELDYGSGKRVRQCKIQTMWKMSRMI